MSIFLYIVLLILLLSNPRSKSINNIALVTCLILFCFSTNVADRDGYETDILNVVLNGDNWETLWFSLLMYFNTNNVDLQYLVGGIGCFYLCSLFFVLRKTFQLDNRLIACYMIGLFFLDIVQLRNTLSLTFVLWSLYFLINIQGKRKYLYSSAMIILASMIHASNFFFILLVISEYIGYDRIKKYMPIIVVMMFIFSATIIRYFGSTFGLSDKIERIGDTENTSANSIIMNVFFVIAIFGMVSVFFRFVKNGDNTKCKELMMNWGYISLTLIPMLMFSQDFRRQIFMMFLIVSALAYKSLNSRSILSIAPVLFSIMLFMMSTYLGNSELVFYPVFDNNILLNFLWR